MLHMLKAASFKWFILGRHCKTQVIHMEILPPFLLYKQVYEGAETNAVTVFYLQSTTRTYGNGLNQEHNGRLRFVSVQDVGVGVNVKVTLSSTFPTVRPRRPRQDES